MFVELSNKTNSQGINCNGIPFNNSTVVKFDGELPNEVKAKLSNGILKETTKAAYDAYMKLQNEAADNAKKQRELRKQFVNELETDKNLKAGKETPKDVETNSKRVNRYNKKDNAEKAAAKNTAPKTENKKDEKATVGKKEKTEVTEPVVVTQPAVVTPAETKPNDQESGL